jgi:hypothetical protein
MTYTPTRSEEERHEAFCKQLLGVGTAETKKHVLNNVFYADGSRKISCENCARWGPTRWLKDHGRCLLAASTDGEADSSESRAVAFDFEGYHADLLTHAEFACNQHAPRKETNT